MRKFIILTLVMAGVAMFLLWNKNTTEIISEPSSTPSVAGTTYEWVLKEGETGSSGVPNTVVGLKVNGKSYPLGEYDGNCREVKSDETGILAEKADAGEISRAQCWFGGGGYEFGVFKSGNKIVVKVGELEEGDKDSKSSRGNWKTLLEL